MKRIGLIGGTTWLSTAEYYRNINLMVHERLGGEEFASLTLESLNFGELRRNLVEHGERANTPVLVAAGKRLAASGVAGIALCANTMHLFAAEIGVATGLPIIHIADANCAAIKKSGIGRVGLLGTRITMEEDIYFSKLRTAGITCVVPNEADKETIHESIFSELAKDNFSDPVRAKYLGVIDRLGKEGAEGVILGCTEIPLLLKPEQVPMPSFDTTTIHCAAIVNFMLSEG
ncbi:MAG TPA: amino acid racemase [Fimbriimonadaceae bacterium]|jgi:aspartate racemase